MMVKTGATVGLKTENSRETPDAQAKALAVRIRERARNLYLTRQMLCTEAVLAALNNGLDGGLTDAQATAMAAPFSAGMGKSGCVCGALSGAVMASGLLLGQARPGRHRKAGRHHARRLHDAFKDAHGATCCRLLSNTFQQDKNAHFRQCADFTAQAAEMAARLVLQERPGLIERVNYRFLAKRQSFTGGMLLRLVNFFRH